MPNLSILTPSPAQHRRTIPGPPARRGSLVNSAVESIRKNSQKSRGRENHEHEPLPPPTLPSLDLGNPLFLSELGNSSADPVRISRNGTEGHDLSVSFFGLSDADPVGRADNPNALGSSNYSEEDLSDQKQPPRSKCRRRSSFSADELDHVDGNVVRHAVALLNAGDGAGDPTERRTPLEVDLLSRIKLVSSLLSAQTLTTSGSPVPSKCSSPVVRKSPSQPPPGNLSAAAERDLPYTPEEAQAIRSRQASLPQPVRLYRNLAVRQTMLEAEKIVRAPSKCSDCNVLLSLISCQRATISRLSSALADERSEREEAETARQYIQGELEDLTSVLFNQANVMVSSERKLKSEAEDKVMVLEKIVEELQQSIRITGYLNDSLPRGHLRWSPQSGTPKSTASSGIESSSKFNDFLQMITDVAATHRNNLHQLTSPFHIKILEEDLYPTLKLDRLDGSGVRALAMSILDGAIEISDAGGGEVFVLPENDDGENGVLEGIETSEALELSINSATKPRQNPRNRPVTAAAVTGQQVKLRRLWSELKSGLGISSSNLQVPRASKAHSRSHQQIEDCALMSAHSWSQGRHSCVLCGSSNLNQAFRVRIRSRRAPDAEDRVGNQIRGLIRNSWTEFQPSRDLTVSTEKELVALASNSSLSPASSLSSSFSVSRASWSRTSHRSQPCMLFSYLNTWFPLDSGCYSRLSACIRYATWLHAVRLHFWSHDGHKLREMDRATELRLFRECQSHRLEMATARLGEMGIGSSTDRRDTKVSTANEEIATPVQKRDAAVGGCILLKGPRLGTPEVIEPSEAEGSLNDQEDPQQAFELPDQSDPEEPTGSPVSPVKEATHELRDSVEISTE